MNTSKLKTFAQQSRNILKEGVKQKLRYWGFNAKGEVTDEPMQVGGGVILRSETIDDPTVLPKWEALRESIRRHGVDAVVEEAAYTWFNRLMAVRILSKNGYEPAQLEYEDSGSRLPLILAKARRGTTLFLNKQENARLQLFITDYSQETRAFAILITGYCHSHNLLNRVFGRLNDFTELLLPDNILAQNGFIHLLNTTDAIAEEDYKQVELIGWLYQFYISEKKDEVFAGFKKNQKARAEDIPAATQIFTPNWIVKYMVQNTAGRIWLDHHPESKLRETMKYLVESPTATSEQLPPFGAEGGQQAPKSQQSIQFVDAPKVSPPGGTEGGLLPNGDPIHLKLLDPATGSGHILVEGFSLLYDMYMEEYYLPAEAVENILTKNLFGLELDLRAAQLARFAVLLAAAKKVPEILKKDILPRIYIMPEPANFSRQEILDFLGSEGTQYEKVLANALQLMQQAQNLGSVMQFNVTATEREFFKTRWQALQTEARTNLTTQQLAQKLEPFLDIFFALTRSYEAIAANPPYMGGGNMNSELSTYIGNNYPTSKSDLMTVFMDVIASLTRTNALYSLINLPSWLFISSFEKLRINLLKNYHIESLLHMGRGIFGIDFGSVAFTVRKKFIKDGAGIYFRLHERNFQHIYYEDIKKLFLYSKGNLKYKYDFSLYRDEEGVTEIPEKGTETGLQLFYQNIPQSNFYKIPGSPIAYWVSDKFCNAFKFSKELKSICEPKQGMATTHNDLFMRNWWEISDNKFGKSYGSNKEAILEGKKWIPYSKGGSFKKWYGNNQHVVNFEHDGNTICKYIDNTPGVKVKSNGRVINRSSYYKEAITWSLTSSNNFGARYRPQGFIFDVNGMSLFPENEIDKNYLISFLNSKVAFECLKFLNPTMAFQKGDIEKLPILSSNFPFPYEQINTLIHKNKQDWDSYETSWDFKFHPLLPITGKGHFTLEDSYNNWLEAVTEQYYQLHSSEEGLNRIFIDIYGLNEELDPIVPLKDITILQEELDRTALEETDKELRKHRQWKLEEGKWHLYVNNVLQATPAEGELPVASVQPALPIKKDVVARQLISYAICCMMGCYSLQKPGLILANQGETLDDYYAVISTSELPVPICREGEISSSGDRFLGRASLEMTGSSEVSPLGGTEGGLELFLPDNDAIIPLMGSNCGFADDALYRLRHFIEVVWGSQSLTQNINFLQSCLDMDLEKYLINQNNFWKDHTSRYKKKPIYWLFSSPTGAFQALVYMHRMNKFTVQKIRDNYLLKHLQWLGGQISQMESRRNSLVRDEQKKLDWMIKAQKECEAYDLHLKDIADRQIEFDLDDGVSVNYPKFEPVVAGIK